jgi:hypothetical protein
MFSGEERGKTSNSFFAARPAEKYLVAWNIYEPFDSQEQPHRPNNLEVL